MHGILFLHLSTCPVCSVWTMDWTIWTSFISDLLTILRIICSGVSDLATDSPCCLGLWMKHVASVWWPTLGLYSLFSEKHVYIHTLIHDIYNIYITHKKQLLSYPSNCILFYINRVMIAFQLYSCENTYNDDSYKNSVVQAVYGIIQPVSDLYSSFNFSASDLIAELFIIFDFNTEPT